MGIGMALAGMGCEQELRPWEHDGSGTENMGAGLEWDRRSSHMQNSTKFLRLTN